MTFEQFLAAAQPVLLQSLYAIFVVAVPLLTKYAVDWLKSKMTEAQLEKAVKWADLIVQFLEQVGEFRGMDNGQKKELAVNRLIEIAGGFGLTLSREKADILIEAAVQRWNEWRNK